MNLLKEIQINKEKINELTKEEFQECIKVAKEYYYNKDSLIEDNLYDLLEETFQDKYPNEKIEIGNLPELKKVSLPYEMYSMNKIKNDSTKLKNYFQKYLGNFVISDKLDGVSALYVNKPMEKKLYTRGNGKIGQDISHLLPFLNLPSSPDCVIRGELIITKEKFKKYQENYSTGRNFVSSMVNSKNPSPEFISDIDLVFYEVIQPVLLPIQQMNWIQSNNYLFSPFYLLSFSNTVNNDFLKNELLKRKEESIYDIDGIIITHNRIYPRLSKNPSHAFAYKTEMDYQIVKTEVVNVEWNVSKDGLLKPKIKLIPIQINNINIEYVSGYNGFYIESNKIGKGCKVEIIRSGDVIPVIRSILTPAEECIFPQEEYEWDDNHVELKLKNKEENKDFLLKEIIYFFKGLKIEKLGGNYINKLYENGYNSIEKIVLMTEEDISNLKNISLKTSTQFYEKINNKIKEITLLELCCLLNIFGRGYSIKKIESIINVYPSLFDFQINSNTKMLALEKIKATKLHAKHICDSLLKLEDFLKKINKI
jgi:NAD-dependent DNA ligase